MTRILLLLLLASCASSQKKNHLRLMVLDHGWFRVHYDPALRLPRYVEYKLKRQDLLRKVGKRRDRFVVDPVLEKANVPRSRPEEYRKTGFDRGHLAPAADFAFSQDANDRTFVMSNIVPQTKRLNRGAWLRLEQQVRRWACGEGELSVLTGPLFSPEDSHLMSGLTVPKRFFKIVIDETPPRKARAYIHYQDDAKDTMGEREVEIREVEKASGIGFQVKFPKGRDNWKSEDCQPKAYR